MWGANHSAYPALPAGNQISKAWNNSCSSPSATAYANMRFHLAASCPFGASWPGTVFKWLWKACHLSLIHIYLKDIAIRPSMPFTYAWNEALNVPMLRTTATRSVWPEKTRIYTSDPVKRIGASLTLIPYFAWANRGEREMLVWLLERE